MAIKSSRAPKKRPVETQGLMSKDEILAHVRKALAEARTLDERELRESRLSREEARRIVIEV